MNLRQRYSYFLFNQRCKVALHNLILICLRVPIIVLDKVIRESLIRVRVIRGLK